MKMSYKKLWKLLIDKDIKKKELCVKARISSTSLAKMGRNENVTTDIIVRICEALNCNLNDVAEIIDDKE